MKEIGKRQLHEIKEGDVLLLVGYDEIYQKEYSAVLKVEEVEIINKRTCITCNYIAKFDLGVSDINDVHCISDDEYFDSEVIKLWKIEQRIAEFKLKVQM